MKNDVFPTHIVIYRDGISGGELSCVYDTEVAEVKVDIVLWDKFPLMEIENLF